MCETVSVLCRFEIEDCGRIEDQMQFLIGSASAVSPTALSVYLFVLIPFPSFLPHSFMLHAILLYFSGRMNKASNVKTATVKIHRTLQSV